MATQDLYNITGADQSLAPAARTASTDGSGVDLQGWQSATALIDAGAWTDGTHTFEVQESDDNSTFTAVADGDLIGTEPVIDAGADGSQIYRVGYIGNKRYVRVSVTVSGATSGAVYGALFEEGHPHTSTAQARA